MENGRRLLGIDGGINGACGLLLPDSIVPSMPNGIFDIPTMGEGVQREINYPALSQMIWDLRPTEVWLEQINAMPAIVRNQETGEDERVKIGSTSLLRFGGAYYAIRAVVMCLGLPLRDVTAAKWKKKMRLKGGAKNKEASRRLAIQLYPSLEPFLRRKKDHQRAEALLIARYGAGQGIEGLELEAEDEQHDDRGGKRSVGKQGGRAARLDLEIPD